MPDAPAATAAAPAAAAATTTTTPAAAPAAATSSDPIAAAAADKAAAAAPDAAGKEAADKAAAEAAAAKAKEGGEKTEAEKAAEAKAKEGEGQQGDFKVADFKMPEGFKMDDTTMANLNGVLKGMIGEDGKVTAAGVQPLIDLHAKMMTDALNNPEMQQGIYDKLHKAQLDARATEAKKQLGADADAKLAVARAAIDGLKIPGLKELANDPVFGAGSDYRFITILHQLGTRMKEAGFDSGQASGGKPREAAEVMFGGDNNK